VEDYLVDTCGLTRPQAIKAYTKISHLKSPANPDAVLTFLAGLGLSSADVAAAVVKDPKLLCAGVGRTLAPVVVGLTDLGFSRPEIARLVHLNPESIRYRPTVSKLHYLLPLFGSVDKLLLALRNNAYLLYRNLDKVINPNVIFLRQCGLCDHVIAKSGIRAERLLTANPECLQEMAACAEGIGLPRGSGMFRQALQAVAFLSKEKITAKVDYLKKTFRWCDAEVSIALTKAPSLLRRSKDMLRRRSELLWSL
jgi:mTERF domain-containing protein